MRGKKLFLIAAFAALMMAAAYGTTAVNRDRIYTVAFPDMSSIGNYPDNGGVALPGFITAGRVICADTGTGIKNSVLQTGGMVPGGGVAWTNGVDSHSYDPTLEESTAAYSFAAEGGDRVRIRTEDSVIGIANTLGCTGFFWFE